MGFDFKEKHSLIFITNYKTCYTGYYYLHNIRKIRRYLTLDSTRCFVHALVMGRVDYIRFSYHLFIPFRLDYQCQAISQEKNILLMAKLNPIPVFSAKKKDC